MYLGAISGSSIKALRGLNGLVAISGVVVGLGVSDIGAKYLSLKLLEAITLQAIPPPLISLLTGFNVGLGVGGANKPLCPSSPFALLNTPSKPITLQFAFSEFPNVFLSQ